MNWYLKFYNERTVLLEIPLLKGAEAEAGRVIYEVLAKHAPASTHLMVQAVQK